MSGEYDPSQPVVFADFMPKEGSVRTRLYITGSNFGTDISRIHVTVGGKTAKVIGTDGNKIYCMVPRRAYSGEIEVKITSAQGDTVTDFTFPDKLAYQAKTTVGTLIRKVDENGNSSNADGAVSEASFNKPAWMMLQSDGKTYKDLYVGELRTSIRKIDLMEQTVSTVITNAQAHCVRMQTFSFTPEGDTLLICDDNTRGSDATLPSMYYALRSEKFRKAQVYFYDWCAYSCVVNPIDHTVYTTNYLKGAVRKKNGQFNATTQKWEGKTMFNVGDFSTMTGLQMNIVMHPTGKYMYILPTSNKPNSILKSNYNESTHEFEYPIVLAGNFTQAGYVDGVGTIARFREVYQGVFVKNPAYAGKADEYDFYVTDRGNHCIRKVTPEGVVTTFAGRGSASADGSHDGYIDGDPRQEARFNRPTGIAYDEEMQTFYVCEEGNHSIRYITTE